jgi:hypothetical protein
MGYVKYKEKICTKEAIRGRIDKYKSRYVQKKPLKGK